jgi:tyrosyl-tRNA synthetase
MSSLDEQVTLLMQGTEYGDEQLQAAMAAELRERLQEGRPLRVYCGYDHASLTTWAIHHHA